MNIINWLQDTIAAKKLQSSMKAGKRAASLETNRIYTMLTGDEPTSRNLQKNGHKETIGRLYTALHDVWSYYWIGARPAGVYSLFQILPSGQQRLVISHVPNFAKANYLVTLFFILDKQNAAYEVIEETRPSR